jgi:hypothetical protein
MSLINHPAFLRTVLRIDAATCVATGLLMAAGSSLVSNFTQIPAGLLTSAGLSLFPIAAFITFVASRAPFWPLGVLLVIGGNIGWVLASIGLLASGAIKPNILGVAFVVVQAAAVALLATLEYVVLGRQQTAK